MTDQSQPYKLAARYNRALRERGVTDIEWIVVGTGLKLVDVDRRQGTMKLGDMA